MKSYGFIAGLCALSLMLVALPGLPALAQEPRPLCDAVNQGRFSRVEKIIRKEMLKHRYGNTNPRQSNASYPSYNEAFDSIASWLNRHECVIATTWDKCQAKILLYPGYHVVGAVFKAPQGPVEKIFVLREGKIRSINRWLGWLHHFKTRERFYYIAMKDDTGFVARQLALCEEERLRYSSIVAHPDSANVSSESLHTATDSGNMESSIPYQSVLGTFVSVGAAEVNDTLTFIWKENYRAVVMTHTTEKGAMYWFRSSAENTMTDIGSYSPWHIQVAKVEIVSPESVMIYFNNSYDFRDAHSVMYQKISN